MKECNFILKKDFCKHPENFEKIIVKKNSLKIIIDSDESKYKLLKILLRKKYGSWKNIIENVYTGEGEKHMYGLKNKLDIYDKSILDRLNCISVGKCIDWACPKKY